jgi:hypothetical protein
VEGGSALESTDALNSPGRFDDQVVLIEGNLIQDDIAADREGELGSVFGGQCFPHVHGLKHAQQVVITRCFEGSHMQGQVDFSRSLDGDACHSTSVSR